MQGIAKLTDDPEILAWRAEVEALGLAHAESAVAPVVTLSIGLAWLVPQPHQGLADALRLRPLLQGRAGNDVITLWESQEGGCAPLSWTSPAPGALPLDPYCLISSFFSFSPPLPFPYFRV